MDNNIDISQESVEIKHIRRVRYSGTHPKKFSEKYKELHPEKYATDVEKIICSGRTPAGMHISICVNEILDFLQIESGHIGLDATLGYGGHARKMLECLNGKGHLYAIDVDPIEIQKTKARLNGLGFNDSILTVKELNFANIEKVAENNEKFDFVLADLGLSSMQIDNPDRGFTYKYDGPLDLRLNPSVGVTAAQRLKELSEEELEELLFTNADETYAKQIASEIIKQRDNGIDITTTKQLAQIITDALEPITLEDRKYETKKSCQRTFQALRIDINKEYEVLSQFLEKLPSVLASGGRVAILTFHSGEDRLVKKSFKKFKTEGLYSQVAKDVIRPSLEECYNNPRAHSAKMRWAIRV